MFVYLGDVWFTIMSYYYVSYISVILHLVIELPGMQNYCVWFVLLTLV